MKDSQIVVTKKGYGSFLASILIVHSSLESQVLTTEVGDWRKNVEAMSGMEGRKKMFDTGGGAQWDSWAKIRKRKPARQSNNE